jgi:hypothetical protein
MTLVADITAIFEDARQVQAQVLERLEAGDIRDTAEKAWCATVRATNALILARTGEGPETIAITSDSLDSSARQDSSVKSLVGRYYSRQSQLHGQCFYNGRCTSPDVVRRIRETSLYIQDAAALANP